MSRAVRSRPLESWVLLHPPLRPSPPTQESALGSGKPLRVFDIVLTSLAWLIICSIVGVVAASTMLKLEIKKSPLTGKIKENIKGLEQRLQSRYLIGVANLFQQGGRQVLAQLDKVTDGSPRGRLKYVVFAGELVGPKEALRELNKLQERQNAGEIDFSADEGKLAVTLRQLYGAYNELRFDAPSVTKTERKLLADELGWAGRLALAPKDVSPPDNVAAGAGAAAGVALSCSTGANAQQRWEVMAPAYRTVAALLGGFAFIFSIGCAGFIGLLVCLVLASMGKIRSHLKIVKGNSSVYAETFALWLVAFLGLGLAAALLPWNGPPLLMSMAAMLLSLGVLVWPLIRGVPWRIMRQEIGLTFGPKPLREILMGPACYMLTLPIAAVGILVTLFLLLAQSAIRSALAGGGGAETGGPAGEPTHPIMAFFNSGSPWLWLQIFLVASVAAPIVEETMFRGVLYRHLRELTGRWGLLLSVLASSLLVSFLFAAVHPQGWLAWPALGSLAMGFALMREWRGSLIAPMIAHGINNGLLMVICFLIFLD